MTRGVERLGVAREEAQARIRRYDAGVRADNSFFYVAWNDFRDPSNPTTGHVGNQHDVRFDRIPVVGAPAGSAVVCAADASVRCSFTSRTDA